MKIFGVKFDFHWSSAMLLVMIMQSGMILFTKDLPSLHFISVLFLSVIFGAVIILSVLLHELGHVIIGRKQGIKFDGITMHAMGGMARMSSAIPNARAEFWMSIAGPAVSLMLFVVFILLSMLSSLGAGKNIHFDMVKSLTLQSARINLALFIFNMLPIFPLDGGRVLRSIIWGINKNYAKATRLAAVVGMFMAGVLGVMGLVTGDVWMTIMAAFICFLAYQEFKNA